MSVDGLTDTANNGSGNNFTVRVRRAEIIAGGFLITLLLINIFVPHNNDIYISLKDFLFLFFSIIIFYEFVVLCILQNSIDSSLLRPWLHLTIALGLNVILNILNFINDVTVLDANVIMILDSAFSLIFYVFIIIGLLAFSTKKVDKFNRLQIFFDLSIIYISSFVVLSLQFMDALFSKSVFHDAAAQTVILNIIYSLFDLSIIYIVLYISIRSKVFIGRKGKEILFSAVFIFFAADIIDNYNLPRGIFFSGGLDEYMMLVSYMLFFIFAAHQISLLKNSGKEYNRLTKLFNFLRYFKSLIIYMPQFCITILIIYFLFHSYGADTINYWVGSVSIITVVVMSLFRQIYITMEINNMSENLDGLVDIRTKDLNELLKQLEEKDLKTSIRTIELMKSEERYRRLLENFRLGVMIVSKEIIRYANPRILDFLSLKKEDLLNKNFTFLLDYVAPEYKYTAGKLFDEIKTKDAVRKSIQVKIKNREGIDFWIAVDVFPVEIDNELMIQAVIEDITDQKTAENIIRTSEEKYRMLFEIQKTAIVLSDYKTGKILDCNSAATRLYGYSREEFLNRYLPDLAENSEEAKRNLDKDISERPVVLLKRNHKKKDGTVFQVEITRACYSWRSRNVVVTVINDITERINLENQQREYTEKLSKLNENKNKLFSIIAHDLRNPFQGLLGYFELLNSNYESFSDNEKNLLIKELFVSVKTVYSFLNNLLLWARIQSGRMLINPEDLKIKQVINDIIPVMKLNIQNKDIELQDNINEEARVFADAESLKIIMLNIITNAIKFTPRKGKIYLEASTDENTTCIKVKDNGIGIPEEVLSKLFDISERKSRPGTENERGSGFGLTLCKELLEKNSGSISIQSKTGEGTTFTVSLPFCKSGSGDTPQN
jgi:PAS domain S-box-containing protein